MAGKERGDPMNLFEQEFKELWGELLEPVVAENGENAEAYYQLLRAVFITGASKTEEIFAACSEMDCPETARKVKAGMIQELNEMRDRVGLKAVGELKKLERN